MDTLDNNSELWQVDFGGENRHVSFDEMTQWITSGELLRVDRVKKGNLRWIEAGKVPSLTEFFNAKDVGGSSEPVVTTSPGRSNVEVLGPKTVSAPPATASRADNCAVHTDALAAFVCGTCFSAFCKACPNSYGSEVKICPFCGALCSSVAKAEAAKVATQVWQRASTGRFGFGDFIESLKYPFKYKVSLFFGAVMFAFFSVGQGAASFGGAFMLAGAIVCFMCANMLSFGVLANVVENFSQGQIGGNFMPSFDDFNIWDDVVHPFFLMIGVYVSSFGPFIAVIVASFFIFAAATKPPLDSDTASAISSVQRGQDLKQLVAQQNAREVERIQRATDPTKLAESEANDPTRRNADSPRSDPATNAIGEEQRANDLNKQIADQQKAELESTFGKAPATKAAEQKAMIAKVLGYGTVFLIVAGLCLLWGLVYLPAACCVAGYTRSFGATLNPTVGLDTIKRLGGDYLKLLGMGLVIGVISLAISGVLAGLFSAFALPGVGNLPATFVSSLFGFYLSVVFSCTLGLAIFKASDRLQLFKG